MTGREVWHPCIPLEPGDACQGWVRPSVELAALGGAEQALPGEGKVRIRGTFLHDVAAGTELPEEACPLPCRGYRC